MRLAPLHPSLPQNDDPAQQKAREQQLEKARATYQWTTEIPSLPSVPLATDVPSADKPTLAWLLVVLGYAIEILRNQISILLTMHQHLGTKPSDHVAHAQDRLAAIAAMNHNFLAILTNLHTNMQSLFDAGQEVLDELRANLSGLATAAQASEISMDMQKAMESLKKSVNRVAILASDTSLYLTQNVERLMSEMKMYDEATVSLVESNLAAEREIQEQRIDETIALAEKEHGLMQEALEAAAWAAACVRLAGPRRSAVSARRSRRFSGMICSSCQALSMRIPTSI